MADDELTQRLDSLQQEVVQLSDELKLAGEALTDAEDSLEAAERRLAELLTSTSWRMTAIFRIISDVVRLVMRRRRGPLLLPRDQGLKELKAAPQSADRRIYARWIRHFDNVDRATVHVSDRLEELTTQPLISIVLPVYNTPEPYLRAAIDSVLSQIYGNWELCISDDCSTDSRVDQILGEYVALDDRIRVVRRSENGHISEATNSALATANGQWVAFLDHDDVLAEHALALVALAVSERPDAGLLYSDEDKVDDDGHRHSPYFKPDFDPLLLLGQNYLTHFLTIRRDLLSAVNGLRVGFEGAQDWDLVLRVCELLEPSQIVHIPHVLYHWRSHPGSTAGTLSAKPYAVDTGARAVKEHLIRCRVAGQVTTIEASGHNRVRWPIPDPAPRVNIIVPTRDGTYLESCVESLLAETNYPNYELLVVDNGSRDPSILEYLHRRQGDRVKVRRDPRPFNYSALNNAAVKATDGELICLLNDDTQLMSAHWLDEMVGQACQPGIGAVGAKLYYDDGSIQHAGVILGIGGVAGHAYRTWTQDLSGYMGRLHLAQSMSAVTAACMLVRRDVWEQVGGLEEEHLAVAFNDVDFCLRIRQAGWRIVWTPYAELVHHESVSRGSEESRAREFTLEVRYMKERWGAELRNDPAYNPNLTLVHEDWSLAWPPRVSYRFGSQRQAG